MSSSSNQKRRRHSETTDCSNNYELLRLKNLPDNVNLSKLKTFTGKFVVDKSHAVCKGLWKPNTFKLIRDHSTADNEALWRNNAIAVISFKYEDDGKRFYEEVKEGRHVYENSRITIDRVVRSYTFNHLREDVRRFVFEYLNFADKQIAQCVCREWRNFVRALQDVPTVPHIEQDLNAENAEISMPDAISVPSSSKSPQHTEMANLSTSMVAQILSEDASTFVPLDGKEELDTLTRRLSLEDSGALLTQNTEQILRRNSIFGEDMVSAATSITVKTPSSSFLSEHQLGTIKTKKEIRVKTKNQKRLERRKRNVDRFKLLGIHLKSESERLRNQKRKIKKE